MTGAGTTADHLALCSVCLTYKQPVILDLILFFPRILFLWYWNKWCKLWLRVWCILSFMWYVSQRACLQMVFSSKATGTSCFSAGCDVSSPSICICVATVWWFHAAQWLPLRLYWFFHPSILTSTPRHDWSTGELRRKQYECQYWQIKVNQRAHEEIDYPAFWSSLVPWTSSSRAQCGQSLQPPKTSLFVFLLLHLTRHQWNINWLVCWMCYTIFYLHLLLHLTV